ncbi:hypothetical protein [Streptomyces goshikiensis]
MSSPRRVVASTTGSPTRRTYRMTSRIDGLMLRARSAAIMLVWSSP